MRRRNVARSCVFDPKHAVGKNTQNLLTISKVLGLAAIVVVGLVWGNPTNFEAAAPLAGTDGWFASAMIMVLWAYAGWNEAAYIVAEVKDALAHRLLERPHPRSCRGGAGSRNPKLRLGRHLGLAAADGRLDQLG